MTTHSKIPLSLKLVVVYMLLIGLTELVWPFLGIGPDYPDFAARSRSYKAGAYFFHVLIGAGYVVSAFALLQRRPWAPRLAYVVFSISALSSAKGFSWGFAGGRPTQLIYLSSLALFLAWHGFLGAVVYRNRKMFIRGAPLGA